MFAHRVPQTAHFRADRLAMLTGYLYARYSEPHTRTHWLITHARSPAIAGAHVLHCSDGGGGLRRQARRTDASFCSVVAAIDSCRGFTVRLIVADEMLCCVFDVNIFHTIADFDALASEVSTPAAAAETCTYRPKDG